MATTIPPLESHFDHLAAINFHDINLVMFHINDKGPDVLMSQLIQCSHYSLQEAQFRTIATYSMVASCQGTAYLEGIQLLPLAGEPDLLMLIVSFHMEQEGKDIHHGYLQVGIILRKKDFEKLPSIVTLESRLLYLSRILFSNRRDLTKTQLLEFKNNLHYLLNQAIAN